MRKGTRHGWGEEFNSRCKLVVKVSGFTLPSIKPCISCRTFKVTFGGCSEANFRRVAKKFLHLCLAVSGVIWVPPIPPEPPPPPPLPELPPEALLLLLLEVVVLGALLAITAAATEAGVGRGGVGAAVGAWTVAVL